MPNQLKYDSYVDILFDRGYFGVLFRSVVFIGQACLCGNILAANGIAKPINYNRVVISRGDVK